MSDVVKLAIPGVPIPLARARVGKGLELRRPNGRRDRIADPTEAAALIAAISDDERALWATAFYAALRRGELRALLAGARRLEACKLLGWTEVPARVVDSISTATAQLVAERDENTCRLDMKPSESARLGMAIEELDEERRRENKLANLAKNRGDGKMPSPKKLGAARTVVGPAVGMSENTYGRAKTVVKAAEDPATAPEVREGRAPVVFRAAASTRRGRSRTTDLASLTPQSTSLPRGEKHGLGGACSGR